MELQFSSGLTGYPDRVKTGWEEARDGEEPEAGSSGDVSMEAGSNPGLVLRKYVFYLNEKKPLYAALKNQRRSTISFLGVSART